MPGAEADFARPNFYGRTDIERKAARFGEKTADGISLFGGAGGFGLGATKAASRGAKVGASATGGSGGKTRLFRAVEPEELADVIRYGDYNIEARSTFKRFAFDEKSLDEFIRANPNRSYTKTYIDLPTYRLGQMQRHADPGGVGRSIGIDVYEHPEFYQWFDRVHIIEKILRGPNR
ncbi:hypothetical protein EON81_23230 [bacterium]|nr:MAG: hypothetical protein EON81_23230 [bacterium]